MNSKLSKWYTKNDYLIQNMQQGSKRRTKNQRHKKNVKIADINPIL